MMTYNVLDLGRQLEIKEELFLSELLENSDGLTILLNQTTSKKRVKIQFSYVYFYRSCNESYRLKTTLGMQNSTINLFYEVINSDLLEWFNNESMDIYATNGIKHIMIFTGEEIIDVLSNVTPIIEFVN